MKAFRKNLSLFLLLCLVFSLVACSKPTPVPEQQVVVDTEGMTDLQKAVVITAESYYLRGKRAQYDQYSLTKKSGSDVQTVYRRLTGIKTPEDYTSQNYGYTDCSGFVYDVYNFALDMPITTGSRNTKAFSSSSVHTILCEYPEKDKFSQMSDEELAAKKKAFTDMLQPGDIIVYRYAGNNAGHAMLYVGNGMMIHSSGSTYNFDTGTDKVEKNGTYLYESIQSSLLSKGNRRYLFDKYVYVILRPLNKFDGEIPTTTQQRMNLMRGIMAEKLSSHTYGQTVNPGDTINYTFHIENKSNLNKTLSITDTLSAHTTYVSGADTVKGSTLSWSVTVPAGETVEISYSVKVKDSAPLGEYIVSDSSVSGIAVNCPRFRIAKTLSAQQQTSVIDKLNQLKAGDLKGIQLANAVYEQAIGKAVFSHKTTDELWTDLVKPMSKDYVLCSTLPLYNMIAPSLYGGKNLGELDASTLMAQERTRLVTKDVLMLGDIVLVDNALYIFTGVGLYNLSYGGFGLQSPESLLAFKRFVVLRPSMVF